MMSELRPASYHEPKTPDYNVHKIGDLLGSVLEHGERRKTVIEGPIKRQRRGIGKRSYRLSPTNSERMNRSLKELGKSAFKVHMLLWQWRGAPAKGHLPFFTIHSLGKFCSLTRPTVRMALRELVDKGWIQKLGYSKHIKNELYRLISIRDVPIPG